MIELNLEWSLWYHPIKSNDWSKDSYMFVYRVKTAEEFWGLIDCITYDHLKNGMYFIMRDDIFPDWTDERNLNGGYWSMKVNDKSMMDVWTTWLGYMISENICDTCNNEYSIQGISFSPKINHSIIKLWNSNSNYNHISLFNKDLSITGCKYFAFNTK